MKLFSYWILLTLPLLLTGCGQSSFDAEKPINPEDTSPSEKLSSIKVPLTTIADGISAAEVIIEIKSGLGQPITGIVMRLEATGSNNVIVPCTPSDANGFSRCKVYSTTSEEKKITAWGDIMLSENTFFVAARPLKTSFAFVSSGDAMTLPSGHRIIASSGIIEDAAVLYDSNGTKRVHTSVQGSMLED